MIKLQVILKTLLGLFMPDQYYRVAVCENTLGKKMFLSIRTKVHHSSRSVYPSQYGMSCATIELHTFQTFIKEILFKKERSWQWYKGHQIYNIV